MIGWSVALLVALVAATAFLVRLCAGLASAGKERS